MKVELVSKTHGVGKYENLNTEEIISAIARHGVIKEDNGKLVKYLMDHKHWSPLDMVNFTFEIETSRAIGRQILRHFSIKFQEMSRRYSENVKFEPVELRKEHPTNRQSSTEVFDPSIPTQTFKVGDGDAKLEEKASVVVNQFLQQADELYRKLLDAGVAKECARMILPECASSTMSMNGTLRSWLSFLNTRCDHHAQKEVVEIATLIGQELEKELPNIFATIDWRNGMFM